MIYEVLVRDLFVVRHPHQSVLGTVCYPQLFNPTSPPMRLFSACFRQLPSNLSEVYNTAHKHLQRHFEPKTLQVGPNLGLSFRWLRPPNQARFVVRAPLPLPPCRHHHCSDHLISGQTESRRSRRIDRSPSPALRPVRLHRHALYQTSQRREASECSFH